MKYLYSILLLVILFDCLAQDDKKSKYVGTWQYSRYYTSDILKIKRFDRVVYYHSGCTSWNVKRKGTWEFYMDSIKINLPNDTNIFYLREKRLGSYINDTLMIDKTWGYGKVHFRKPLGNIFKKEFPLPLTEKRRKKYARRSEKLEETNP